MNSIVLPKGLNLDLIKSLDPAANLQEMQRKEEYAELHHEWCNQLNLLWETQQVEQPSVLQKINCQAKEGMEEESLD